MPRFSLASLKALHTCVPPLQELAKSVVKDFDCSVIEGHRGRDAQESFFSQGLSKVHWPNGAHNAIPSRAVHLVPWPIEWRNTKRFYHFAGFVRARALELGIKIRWGGDWDGDYDLDDQTFFDLIHYELL